jgi:hypothetical protein
MGLACNFVQFPLLNPEAPLSDPFSGSHPGSIAQAVGGPVGSAVRKAATAVTGDVLGQIAQAMATAADGLLKTLSTFWMKVDTPALAGSGSPVAVIQADTKWITTSAAVVCILVAAGRLAIRRRGESVSVMMLGLVRLVFVSAAATALVEAAGQLGDTFSSDLMSASNMSTGGWSGIISTTTISASFATGNGMLLIIALLLIITSLIQLMLMVLRVGLLVILTGTLPLAAAASMSEWGETWWRKHLAWLAAWLLYKPAAAILYAGAFTLTHGKDLVEVLSGFMLLILSVLILPALLKVIVPMTASLGAASSGALAMGTAGALATGAIKVAAMAGTGGAGAAGAAAPSGNSIPAGGSKVGAPEGARPSGGDTAPSRSSPVSNERAVVLPSGGQSAAEDDAGRADSQPRTGSNAAGSPPQSAQPGGHGGAGTDPGTPPPFGAVPPERNDVTAPGGPSGAADDGDTANPGNGDPEIGGMT